MITAAQLRAARLLLGISDEKRQVAQAIDAPRIAAGQLIECIQGIRRENLGVGSRRDLNEVGG